MHIVLIGPPGAGKGTQAAALSEHLNIPHISTGELFREQVGRGSPLGLEVKRYLDTGELVPDRLTADVVRERLALPDARKGFLLDGFPRNEDQVDLLDGILEDTGQKLDAVLELDVPEDIVLTRLLSRGRPDDTEEVIRRRLQVYRTQTAPLLKRYNDIRVAVDAVGSVDEVRERALKALKALSRRVAT